MKVTRGRGWRGRGWLLVLFFFWGIAPARAFQDIPTAYVLERGVVEGSFFYNRMDDTLDVFGLGNLENRERDTVGTFQSFDFLFNLGLFTRLTTSFQFSLQDFAFEDRELDIRSFNVGLRFQLLEERDLLPALAAGFNYKGNRASQVTIDGEEFFLGGLQDDTYAFSLLASKQVGPFSFHPLFSYAYTDLPRRSQNTFGVGIGIHWQPIERLLLRFRYEHLEVSRGDGVPDGANNLLEGGATVFVHPKVALSLRARFFTNLFQGEIPFIFQEAIRFRNKNYGYLGVGVTVFLDLKEGVR